MQMGAWLQVACIISRGISETTLALDATKEWTNLCCGSSNPRNRYGRRVSGQYGVGWAGLCKLGEDLGLQVKNLGHSLNNHIHIVKVLQLGGGSQASTDGVGIGLRELLLGDILGEQLVGKGKALVD